MKFLMLAAAAVLSLGLVGCSDDDNGNNVIQPNTFAPNSCFNSGGPNRYQWINGQCQDVQQNSVVSQNLCANSQVGNTFDQRCNFYGGSQFFPGQVGGGINGSFWGGVNSDACSIYNNGIQQYHTVFLPQAGGYVCISNNTFNHIGNQFGAFPGSYYSQGYLTGCYPGYSSCNCNGLSGSLGWFHGGISLGICF